MRRMLLLHVTYSPPPPSHPTFLTFALLRVSSSPPQVFYIPQPLTVHVGEEVQGSILCAPNDRNLRDLDIVIGHRFHGRAMQSENKQLYKLR